MSERSSVFDMIGPIMIGPSSSHTAGVARLACTARNLLGEVPKKVTIMFYNSFARTYQGHGSDRAVIGGILGYRADDPRIRDSLHIAKKQGLYFEFKTIPHAINYHPNTLRLLLQGPKTFVNMLGVSIGGGNISVLEINGFNTRFSVNTYTLVLFSTDVRGNIAHISSVLAYEKCNIASMTVARKGRHQTTCLVIEIDTALRSEVYEYIRKIHWVRSMRYLTPLY